MTSDIQAVLDAAASLTEGTSDETQTEAIVPLGSFEDLSNMVYQWRAAGGKTTDELIADLDSKLADWRKSRAEESVIDPVCGSGNIYVTPQAVIDLIRTEVSSRPCQTCWHPEWLHDGGPCCGQNAADTGGCVCKMFVPRKGTT